jgi:hypothetical protein
MRLCLNKPLKFRKGNIHLNLLYIAYYSTNKENN